MDDRNIRTVLGADGVLVASIDMPGRSMNVFSVALMDAMDRLLDTVAARGDIRAVVLASGKPTFLVGADLEMVRMFTQRARTENSVALHALCGRLGRIFRRLETQGKPFVAAINGLALGGGLELALACHERVAADSAQMGLPEIKLGLLPGAGGTQRLPRLLGQREGLELMLSGEARLAERALDTGMVDGVVPPDELLNDARRRALRLAARKVMARWDRDDWCAPTAGILHSESEVSALVALLGISTDQRRLYPAYDAIISCVRGGWNLPMSAAGDWEMDRFVELIQDPVAGNMIRALFLDRQRAAKATMGPAIRPARARVTGARSTDVASALRSAHVEVTAEEEAGVVTIATCDTSPAACRFTDNPSATVAWLRDSSRPVSAFGASVGVWMGDAGAFGRACEVCVEPGGDSTVGLDVARWLRATAMVTQGPSLLQRLSAVARMPYPVEDGLLAVALEAARAWTDGSVADLGIADSIVVTAGLYPPYTGGPYNYLRQRGLKMLTLEARKASERHGAGFELPERWVERWTTFERAEATVPPAVVET